jgi:cell division protein FtsZ
MGVRGVTDLMVNPGMVNLDFADIRTVMAEMGKAMMGTGEAEGEDRAVKAAEAAISNPLLEDTSMRGAKGVLINITGGLDMTLFEVDEAAMRIRREVDEEANIIFGSSIDDTMNGRVRVSVVATGIDVVTRRPAPGHASPWCRRRPRRRRARRVVAPAPAAAAPPHGRNAGMAACSRAGPAAAAALVEEAMPQPVACRPPRGGGPVQGRRPRRRPARAGGWRNLFQTATGPDAAQAPGRCAPAAPPPRSEPNLDEPRQAPRPTG